jgi:hypothetical protein
VRWNDIDVVKPPKDGTAVLFCRSLDADGQPIEPDTIRSVFCQVASWWGGENGGEGQWVVYCSMVQDPYLHFEPTHWRAIDVPGEVPAVQGTAEAYEDELEEMNRALQDEREKWRRLQAKVEQTLENLDRGRKRAEAELVMAANSLKLAKPPEHEAATAKAMLMAEEARRAYAMYDAIRSVKIWLEGYL